MPSAPSPVNNEHHWRTVYSTADPRQVGWHTPRLETSLRLIAACGRAHTLPLIDVGGGASTLPDDLLAEGYQNITVLDLAPEALAYGQKRLGAQAGAITWMQGDVTRVPLPQHYYGLWHDRAVFHFLLEPAAQRAYVQQMENALMPGAWVVMATFGPQGPTSCSGLPTRRYSAEELAAVVGPAFTLRASGLFIHTTPCNTTQQFLYVRLQKNTL